MTPTEQRCLCLCERDVRCGDRVQARGVHGGQGLRRGHERRVRRVQRPDGRARVRRGRGAGRLQLRVEEGDELLREQEVRARAGLADDDLRAGGLHDPHERRAGLQDQLPRVPQQLRLVRRRDAAPQLPQVPHVGAHHHRLLCPARHHHHRLCHLLRVASHEHQAVQPA